MCMLVHEVPLESDGCSWSLPVPWVLQWWNGFQEGSKQERGKKEGCALCGTAFLLCQYCTRVILSPWLWWLWLLCLVPRRLWLINTHCCLLGRAWVSHTLVWIVHVCVSIYACLLAARTINIKSLSISWRSTLWSMWRPVQGSVRVQCGQLKLNHMWQLDFWFVLLPTINGRLLTGGTNLIWAVVEVASGKGHV